jgi:hypothetical protein
VKHFPIPFPDELYYGVVVRAYRELGSPAQSTFEKVLFGKHTTCGVLTVKLFPKDMPEGHPLTRETATRDHSLKRLFEAFRQKPLPPSWPDARSLRSCPRCREQDRAKVGEAYWHRLHQIPWLHICHIHKEPLEKSREEPYPAFCGLLRKPNYFTPEEASWESFPEVNLALQKELCELTLQTLGAGKLRPNHSSALWVALENGGWTNGRYLSGRLFEALMSQYGPELKRTFQIPPDEDGKILIRDVVSGGQVQTERVLTLYHFLGLRPGERPEPKEKERTQRKSWSDPTRIEKTRARHRDRFLNVLEQHPKAGRGEINQMDPTCSSWLRLHDYTWWKAQLKTRPVRKRTNYDRVESHDREIAQAIRKVARQLRSREGRPEQITAHRIWRELLPEMGSRLRSSPERLPLAQRAMGEAVETGLEVAQRKLVWARKSLPKDLPKEEFLARAGLRVAVKKWPTLRYSLK